MNSFTPEQKSFIRDVVFEAMPTVLDRHIEGCPWGKKFSRILWVGLGIGIGLGGLGFAGGRQLILFLAGH